MKDFFQNQIAMALVLFAIISVGSLFVLGVDAKEVIIQVITATGALVTGVGIGRATNQRSTDAPLTKEDKPNV